MRTSSTVTERSPSNSSKVAGDRGIGVVSIPTIKILTAVEHFVMKQIPVSSKITSDITTPIVKNSLNFVLTTTITRPKDNIGLVQTLKSSIEVVKMPVEGDSLKGTKEIETAKD